MITFTPEEKKFLESLEESRLATVNDLMPHVKPVSYIFDSELFYVATDYDTRTYKNLKKNPKTALVIDIYKHGGHKAICMQGNATIIESGDQFSNIYQKFFEKFEWVRKEPWKENEAPFLEIKPITKVSWGIN